MVLRVFLTLSLLLFSSVSVAATRATIFPGTGQALVVIQGFDRHTGVADDDPYRLYATMDGPLRKGPSGDEGKIAETQSRDFNLTCVERLQTGTVQCQFVIQTSSFCNIDPLMQAVRCKWSGEEAVEVAKFFRLGESNVLSFVTSDSKLHFSVSQNQVKFDFQ